jgi:hypothetical protein
MSEAEELAKLLAKHRFAEAETPSNGWVTACDCGWVSGFPGPDLDGEAAYDRHLAEVVEASDWLREQRAKAWATCHVNWFDWTTGGFDKPKNPFRTTEEKQ